MRGPRLLGQVLPLHDVRDIEAHVRSLLDARLAEWGARLDPERYEDALSYLLGKAVELSKNYRPSPDLAFSTYSRRILRARVVDWYRLTFHDARYVQNVTTVSLYGGIGDDDEQLYVERDAGELDELNRHSHRDEMEEVLTRVALDS